MTKTYSYDDVRSATVDYFKGDELAADVFASKYALQDLAGNLYELTPADMHRRLAREFARIESKYASPMSEDDIFALFSSWDVVPQGSPMSAIGNPHQVQSLSNCFVIEPPSDSYGGILRADQEEAQVMKRRGGVGFDMSNIRPKGMSAANAARTTDGIGVFMERFSNTCREVAQGGRRGALMLTISCEHPEVETFIDIKRDTSKVTGANVSIRWTDAFIKAVVSGDDFDLTWPIGSKEPKVTKRVKARDVWLKAITAAWSSAEPGALFWDTLIRESPADCYADQGFKTVSTNPCGELPLCAGDSCRLLLVNVNNFVTAPYTNKATFDETRFASVVQKAQRLMDDLVDLEIEALDKIIVKVIADPEDKETKRVELNMWERFKKAAQGGRRTGLGITGLGDALAALGIRYGTDKSVKATEDVYRQLALNAYASSVQMAKERGTFEVWDKALETSNPYLARLFEADDELKRAHARYGRRNIALLTTAPAGSVSIMTQTTSGCEPAYMLRYKRRRKVNSNDAVKKTDMVDSSGDAWQEYEVFHPGFKRWMDVTGHSPDDVEKSPYHKATSNDVDWVKSVDLQAAAQRWIDHAISKTVNLPSDATVELVDKVFRRAWEKGCKGITVYRDGSRTGVLVAVDQKPTEEAHGLPSSIIESHAPRRPKDLQCDLHRVTVRGETYLVIVGLFDGKPYETFAGLEKNLEVPKKAKKGVLHKNGKNKDGLATYNLSIPIGDDEIVVKDIAAVFDNPEHGALTRLISMSLRHGVPVPFLCEQMRKDKHSDLTSFSSVIARVLSKSYIKDGTPAGSQACGQCGSTALSFQQGCVQCTGCGWSRCQ